MANLQSSETATTTREFLRAVPYFAGLDSQDLDRVAGKAITRQFVKGSTIFLERSPCEGIYFVRSGQVKVFKVSSEGKEQILRMMEERGIIRMEGRRVIIKDKKALLDLI